MAITVEADKGPSATPIEDEKANVHSFQEAQAASAAEHDTDFRTALRENWKAVLWSMVISLTIVMEGYV
jgi:SP family general alpha glucoside:H+ symporter-like MFS transporter